MSMTPSFLGSYICACRFWHLTVTFLQHYAKKIENDAVHSGANTSRVESRACCDVCHIFGAQFHVCSCEWLRGSTGRSDSNSMTSPAVLVVSTLQDFQVRLRRMARKKWPL